MHLDISSSDMPFSLNKFTSILMTWSISHPTIHIIPLNNIKDFKLAKTSVNQIMCSIRVYMTALAFLFDLKYFFGHVLIVVF